MLHAVLNMLMGMGSVFVVLVLICLCIYSFNIFPYMEKRRKEKKAALKASTETFATEEAKQAQQIPSETQDEALVAAIMAAITAYTGLSQDEFIVRSIVRR